LDKNILLQVCTSFRFLVHLNFHCFFKPKEFTNLFEDIPEILETSFDVCFLFSTIKDEKSSQQNIQLTKCFKAPVNP